MAPLFFTFVFMAFLAITPLPAQGGSEVQTQQRTENSSMMIKMGIGDISLVIELDENPTSRDFYAMLPLELQFSDYANTEKISYLPEKLDTTDAPEGHDPSLGDIALYSPWGNLVLYYKDFRYSSGLVMMGRITTGLDLLSTLPEEFTAKIEKIQ